MRAVFENIPQALRESATGGAQEKPLRSERLAAQGYVLPSGDARLPALMKQFVGVLLGMGVAVATWQIIAANTGAFASPTELIDAVLGLGGTGN